MIIWARRGAGGLAGVNPAVVCPWWSCGKIAIAAAALGLVEAGAVGLDEPLSPAPYSLRQLLGHTAGLTDYGRQVAYHAAVAAGEEPWSVETLLARADADRLIFPPGRGWSYSNIGYLHVRGLIERITGQTLGAVLAERHFRPLGLHRTRLATLREDLAGVALAPADYHPGWVYHGLLVGPADEATAWLAALFDGRLLGAAALAAMTTPRLLGDIPGRIARKPAYGLGLMIEGDRLARPVFGHTGAGPGSLSALYRIGAGASAVTVGAFAPWPDADQGRLEMSVLDLADSHQAAAR